MKQNYCGNIYSFLTYSGVIIGINYLMYVDQTKIYIFTYNI